jgi:membrane fusion protein, copper/silver efflux system
MKTNAKSLTFLLVVSLLGFAGYIVRQDFYAKALSTEGRKVRFYQDSMHPWIKSEQPGKCTICSMDLTPIYEGEKGFGDGENMVVLSSNNITVLHVQTEEVKRQPLFRTLRVAGTLEANETRKTIVAAPVSCRIQALAVEYAGVEVEQGQVLMSLFSPELVQRRAYLSALGVGHAVPSNYMLQASAKIDPYTSDLVSPQSGTVIERNVYEGQYVEEGDRLLTIVDPSVLWFRFDVYERQLPWFEPGQTIEVTVGAVPRRKFPAAISFIEPTLNDATRTVKVRADIRNPIVIATNGHPQRLLRFGMYAEGLVRSEVPNVLTVPRTAILFPGVSSYAYIEKGDGVFERRLVKLGRQGDEYWEVLQGLDEGDRVVVSGNVLMDAQAQFNQHTKPEESDSEDTIFAEPGAGRDSEPEAANHVANTPGMEMTDQYEPPTHAQPRAASNEELAPMALISKTNGPGQVSEPSATSIARARLDARYARAGLRDEMRQLRRAAIAAAYAEHAEHAENPTLPATATRATDPRQVSTVSPETMPERATNAIPFDAAQQILEPAAIQTSSNKVRTHREADIDRRTLRDEMWKMRQAALVEANRTNTENTIALTTNQSQAIAAFLSEVDGISRALAEDDLEQFNRHVDNLSGALTPLRDELGEAPRWGEPIQRLVAMNPLQPAQDLAEARRQFLPFSTAAVEFAKWLRKEDSAFAGLKIYHCPMAPKPGLWMQAEGPLANPFYGAKMLKCGEEIKP